MVCHRCVLAVEEILTNASITFDKVVIGEIQLPESINSKKVDLLGSELSKIGLELLDNRIQGMIEKIKQLVLKKARNEGDLKSNKQKLSVLLTDQLHLEYTYLSSVFSSIEGRTIENYFIEQRIEKVKELLVYNEMNLSQIAYEMDYSSVAHLSNQFKKITGLTPSHFKQVGNQKRQVLDQI